MHSDPVARIDDGGAAASLKQQGNRLHSSDHMIQPGSGRPEDPDIVISPVSSRAGCDLQIRVILLPVVGTYLYVRIRPSVLFHDLRGSGIKVPHDQVCPDLMPRKERQPSVGGDYITVLLYKREGKVIIDLAPCDNHSMFFHCSAFRLTSEMLLITHLRSSGYIFDFWV